MAEDLFKEWEDCLNNGDLDGILGLYADNAVLWGTFSDIIRDNRELIREYFEDLFLKENLKVKFGASNSRTIGEDAICSGVYEFSYQSDEKVICPARFSFVFHKSNDGQYKIMDHHSSLVPGTY